MNKKIKRRFNFFSLKYLWPIFPAILIVAITILLNRSDFFSIKNIDCQLDKYPCSSKFDPILVNLHNQNIFTLKLKTISLSFQELDPSITDIKITKKLPQGLKINMTQRIPLAQVAPTKDLEFLGLESSQSASLSGKLIPPFFTFDNTGTVFSQSENQDPQLIPISIPENQSINLGENQITALLADLISTLKSQFVNFTTAALINENLIIVKINTGPFAVISTSKDFTPQVATLQYILSGFKIGDSLPTKIDLRFDKPILTY